MKKWRYCIVILIFFVWLILPVVADAGKLALPSSWEGISKINMMGANRPTWLTGKSVGILPQESVPSDVPVSTNFSLAALRLSFVPNAGQVEDPQVKFMIKTSGSSLFFTPDAVYLTAMSGDEGNQTAQVVRQSFPGANSDPAITGTDPLSGTANFLFGSDPAHWQQNVSTYGKIVYHDLYHGIDLSYFGNDGHLKREFTVAPGADPAAITFAYEGVTDISIDATGALHLATASGELIESPPVCYQIIDGRQVVVVASYVISDIQTVKIRLGHYDPSYVMVIDPELVYATYYGGKSWDEGMDIAVDSSGNAYITGETSSTDFLTTTGAMNSTFIGFFDIFVVKLNPTGSAPVYSTYLGGTDYDIGQSIAVDSSGNAYITGETSSTDFLTTPGAVNSTVIGDIDIFVVKLNPTGSAPVYATYYGGTGRDRGYGIAVDNSGNAYITGHTYSTDFLTTPGVVRSTYSGIYEDAFVVKLNPAGSAPVYATYYGGTNGDYGNGIAVDNLGNAYITGVTMSTDFLTTPGALRRTYIGASENVFVVKLNPTGSAPVYATYYGGTGINYAQDIAVDGSGNAYITGFTNSTDFLTTPGAVQTSLKGNTSDAFVVKLNPAGSAPIFATYYGGTRGDWAQGIAVDGSGNAYITGDTQSNDFLTTPGAMNSTFIGHLDTFVVKLNPTGSAPVYATYYGGTGADQAQGIAVDGSGNAYITGGTDSPNFPTTSGAVNSTFIGNSDAFVVKLNLGGAVLPPQILSPVYGPLEIVNTLNNCPTSKWCFNQHKTGGHVSGGGIGQADDTFAWDANLNYPTWDSDYYKPVYAIAPGIVPNTFGSSINAGGSYGQLLIEHSSGENKWWSGYLHLSNIQVTLGQQVTESTLLGYISNVSPVSIPNHLHFVVYNGSNTLGGLKSFNATIIERDTSVSEGIDVSKYQGSINWTKVKTSNPSLSFVFVRSTFGSFNKDNNFSLNMQGADNVGLKVLPYHCKGFPGISDRSSDTDIRNDARDEANKFYLNASSYLKSGYLQPALDIETEDVNTNFPTNVTKLVIWIDAWIGYLKEKNPKINPIIYTSDSVVTRIKTVKNYPHWWIARWGTTPPNNQWTFWQYTNQSSIPGIIGFVDADRYNGNITQLESEFMIPTSNTEIGVVRNNKTWILDASGNGVYGAGDVVYNYGIVGDVYVTGDWNGDSITEIGLVRNNNTWLLDASGNGLFGPGDLQYTFGKAGDVYVTGDWNGNGTTKIGVVRFNTTWLLDASGDGKFGPGDYQYVYGRAGDVYVTGDWNGNGTTKIGVVRNNKTWILDASGNGVYGAGDIVYNYGIVGDRFVTGDWDGNGTTRIGVVRFNTTWLLDASGNGLWSPGDYQYVYGRAGDRYVTGKWS